MKTDKELADQLDAEDRLRARGFKKIPCKVCKGFGYFNSVNTGESPGCPECGGKGHTWRAPMT